MKKTTDRPTKRPPSSERTEAKPYKRPFKQRDDSDKPKSFRGRNDEKSPSKPSKRSFKQQDDRAGSAAKPYKRSFSNPSSAARSTDRPNGTKPLPRTEGQAPASTPYKRPFKQRDQREGPASKPNNHPFSNTRPADESAGRPNKPKPFRRPDREINASSSYNRPFKNRAADERKDRPSRPKPFQSRGREEGPAPRPRPLRKVPNRPSAGTPPTSKGPTELLKTLDRILSRAGLGSRTEARSWIGTGRVRVNGLLVQTPDYWVNPKTDTVLLDDKPIDIVERRYVLLNKPKGFLTTYKDPENRPTVYDLLKGVEQFLGTVGRLDLDSSGLLLLTNDTDLAEAVTNPAYKLEKTYLVKAATLLTEEQLSTLRQGVELDDGPTKPAEVVSVRQSAKHSFLEITITEGRNRQVRRMLEAIGSKVLKLVRVKLGPLTLEGLPIGTWRDLTEAEVARLSSGKIRPKSKAVEDAD